MFSSQRQILRRIPQSPKLRQNRRSREEAMLRRFLMARGMGAAAASAAVAADSLKVAVSQRGFWDSSFVEFAQKEGFFKEAGLEVEIFYTDGGAATLQTVASGSVDIG